MYMKTAKDLAYKAFCHNLIEPHNDAPYSEYEKQQKFESWWRDWFIDGDRRGHLHEEHSVFIEGRRYIRAE